MVFAYQELERRRLELQNLGNQLSTTEAQFQERYGRQIEGESFIGSPEQRNIVLEWQRKAQLAQQQLKIVQRMGGDVSRYVPLTKLSTEEAVKASEQYQEATARGYEGYKKEAEALTTQGEDYSKRVDEFNQEIQDRTDFMNRLLQSGESVQNVRLYQNITGGILRTGGTTDVSDRYSEGEIGLGGESRPELLERIKSGAIEGSKRYLGVGAEDIVTLNGQVIQESILSPEERAIINEAFGQRQAAMATYERARAEEQDRLKSGWAFAQQDTAKLKELFTQTAGMTPIQAAEFLKANLKGSYGKEVLAGVTWEVGGGTFSNPVKAEERATEIQNRMLGYASVHPADLPQAGREDELPLIIDTPYGKGINPEVFKREKEYQRQEGVKAIERGDFFEFASGGGIKIGLITNDTNVIKNIFGQSEGWSVKLFGGKENIAPKKGMFYNLDVFGNVITERPIEEAQPPHFVDEVTFKMREINYQLGLLTSGIAFGGGIVPVTGRGAGLFAESLPKAMATTIREDIQIIKNAWKEGLKEPSYSLPGLMVSPGSRTMQVLAPPSQVATTTRTSMRSSSLIDTSTYSGYTEGGALRDTYGKTQFEILQDKLKEEVLRKYGVSQKNIALYGYGAVTPTNQIERIAQIFGTVPVSIAKTRQKASVVLMGNSILQQEATVQSVKAVQVTSLESIAPTIQRTKLIFGEHYNGQPILAPKELKEIKKQFVYQGAGLIGIIKGNIKVVLHKQFINEVLKIVPTIRNELTPIQRIPSPPRVPPYKPSRTPPETPPYKPPRVPILTFGSFKDSVDRASRRGKSKYVWNIRNPVPTFRSLFGK